MMSVYQRVSLLDWAACVITHSRSLTDSIGLGLQTLTRSSLSLISLLVCLSGCLSVYSDYCCCVFTCVINDIATRSRDSGCVVVMTTATTARSLADDDDDVSKMMSAGDITELTESERDFRLKTEDQLECDEEEQKRLDELLTQCRDYIYACHSQSHVTSSKIITNGSLTSRSPSSPRDVTSSVMAACWLELPVSSSRDAFPFPANDVVDHSDVTSHIHSYNDVSTITTLLRHIYILLLLLLLLTKCNFVCVLIYQ